MTVVEPEVLVLDGGLRLVHIHQRSAGAGIFGLTVRAGSADECHGEEGLAHFVEHTLFKGTARRSSWHIINRMEAVGGELNAFTSKEETVVYSIFPSGNAPRAIELIADLTINSRFPDKELEKEREVVIDEINSYRDNPSEAIFDDFEVYAMSPAPTAHNILGSLSGVRRLTSADCRDFLRRNYRSENIVAFYSGPQTSAHIAQLVSRYFEALPRGAKEKVFSETETYGVNRFSRTETMRIHQTHAILGCGGPGLLDSRRHALALFANIVGGPGMNSLLNVELRERRGLVYSVEASTAMFTDCGLLTVYFGCDREDLDACRRLCIDVFHNIADGNFSARRLEQAKKQYLGQLAIAFENRENRIMDAARAVLFRGTLSSYACIRDAINAVTPDDIVSLAVPMCEPSELIFTYK